MRHANNTSPPFDFRSDTVTRPTRAMLATMTEAPLGDDVLGDDPTVTALECRIAEMLGKEAALYVPSGSMSNLIGLRLHCSPGDEMLCDSNAHVYFYEQGGYAQINGIAAQTVETADGVMTRKHLEGRIRPNNIHFTQTRLLTLENTHNRHGGKIQPYETVADTCGWARENDLKVHLDGARLFNAVVATGIEASRWASHFDTVNICFSKGLGAPVGSALCGTQDHIDMARRHRKVLGGGMRQAGVIAAAALYALDHHIDRLGEDHVHAQMLAEGIEQIEELTLSRGRPETNLVFFDVDSEWGTAEKLTELLAEQGVLMLPLGPQTVRAVTHLDVDSHAITAALNTLKLSIQASR